MYPQQYHYIQGHLWVQVKKDILTTGITAFPLEQYGDFYYCDLPEVGTEVEQLQEIGALETGKEVFTLVAPVSGEIIAVNEELLDNNLDMINESPYDSGWLFQIRIIDEDELDNLLTAEEYDNYISNLTEELEEEPEF